MADVVRAGSLWGYAPLAHSLGGDPDALLAEAGLPPGGLADPDAFIPRRKALELLERSAEALVCPDFGMRLAGLQDLYVLGPLAFAIRNAPDVGSALRTASRHLHTQAPEASLTIQQVDGSAARIIFQAEPPAFPVAPQGREHVIALIRRLFRLLTAGSVQPTGIHFRHLRVSSIEAYEAHLGTAPEFGMDVDALVVRMQDFRAPLAAADQQLRAIVERYLEARFPPSEEHLPQQVRHVLTRLVRTGPARIGDVAAILRVHPRTLQRKLQSEGVSFEQVRDEARRELAEIYLAHDEIPIAQVAHLLGYADQSVLTRSCLRWFGKTPLAVRRDHAGRGADQRRGAA